MKLPPQALAAALAAPGIGIGEPAAAQERSPEPEAKSIFPDKNLEAVVRQQVFAKRDNDEPITADDVRRISTIRGTGVGIKDLAGLEHCGAVMSIVLPENEVSDLGPLENLDRLQMLDLRGNQITDLTPIAGVKSLQYLAIDRNRVESLAPLAGLERLSSLYADRNRISDISPVLELPELGAFYLKNNRIETIEGIGTMGRDGFVRSIALSGNRIADLDPIRSLKPRSFLFLEDNRITDLGPLVEMMKADIAGDKRFAPYVQVYLEGNPLNDKGERQVEELNQLKIRIRNS